MEGVTLGGRPWMELDLDQGHVPPALRGLELGGNDPRALVDALAGAGGKVDKLGLSTILGEEVTRYQGSVDLDERSRSVGQRLGSEWISYPSRRGLIRWVSKPGSTIWVGPGGSSITFRPQRRLRPTLRRPLSTSSCSTLG